ncbi:hypothetical protein Vi05172_g5898 [Venturia inaequalis]|nr:hypothetical protein Vi05172_g5898 [Venturia inaequalis]
MVAWWLKQQNFYPSVLDVEDTFQLRTIASGKQKTISSKNSERSAKQQMGVIAIGCQGCRELHQGPKTHLHPASAKKLQTPWLIMHHSHTQP